MHKIASENPDKEIDFNFYGFDLKILEEARKFFRKNRDFIPKNVTLHINQHSNGHDIIPIDSLPGLGDIDSDFSDSVRYITERYLKTGALLE